MPQASQHMPREQPATDPSTRSPSPGLEDPIGDQQGMIAMALTVVLMILLILLVIAIARSV